MVVCAGERKRSRYAERVLAAIERDQGPLGAVRRGQLLMEARADAERRIAAQIPDETKRARADFVIENDGSLQELEEKVKDVVKMLRALARIATWGRGARNGPGAGRACPRTIRSPQANANPAKPKNFQ